jgi:2-oxoisovalerate dehydrogenase E2 component (dihydrolipoyl transacylase)
MTAAFASGNEIATLSDEADVEAWWAVDADVTGRLIAAIAVACAAVPALNARFEPAERCFQTLPSVDIGIAIDTERGMVVPVLCDIGHASVTEIRRRLNELRNRAENGPCAPSITLTNFGSIAGRYATLPVPPPQVAAVAAGQVSLQPVRRDRHIVHHHMLPLSLSFDAGASTMGGAAHFLAAMKADLAKPELPLMRGWHAPARQSPQE